MKYFFSGLRPRISQAWFRFRGYGSNGRALDVFPGDRFLVGYPKSGNTWLDFMVACLLAEDVREVDFFSIENYVADIYFNDAKFLQSLSRPRYMKSHEPYDGRYGRMVYIVRDPRDVVVSYYYHHLMFGMWDERKGLGPFVRKFVDGGVDGLGAWGEHVSGWLDARRNDPDFLMVRYEDLKKYPEHELARVASHLGIAASPEKLKASVSWSSVDNMKKLEADAVRREHPGFRKDRKGMHFVRKGRSGGWKESLQDKEIQEIEHRWGGVMRFLGYLEERKE